MPYQVFATQDGYLSLAATTNAQYEHLCQLLDRPALATVSHVWRLEIGD